MRGPASLTDNMHGNVKNDLTDLMHSGQYRVSPDINRGLAEIGSGYDNIKLDQDFLSSSRDWASKFDPQHRSESQKAAVESIDRSQQNVQDIKRQLPQRAVDSLRDNQARERAQWTVNKLNNIKQDMAPHARCSVDRIKQFCDHIGVTDRYTGYRNNLNRGNRNPAKMGFSWMDKKNRELYQNFNPGRPFQSYDASVNNDYKSVSAPVNPRQSHGTLDSMHPMHTGCHMSRPAPTKSIQEQCGINTTYPGKTEYMTRYNVPRPKEQHTKGFIINPTPNFYVHGRPLATMQYERSFTEYQTRYEWPEACKIIKLPWLKK
eukprot:GHVU01101540.1.p1 GENE.GHVU01101540.1~~GHVU01101540.1.p1  ORF type:complete len:318 (+),score=24.29 GHVU01101540.1:35-988(+)